MPANIIILGADEPIGTIYLGEVLAPDTFDEAVEGQPRRIVGKNNGTGAVRELSVHLKGEGQRNCQLAKDDEGDPGIWAAPGESILVEPGTLYAGDEFSFWARGIYAVGDEEGEKPFEIVFSGVSIGDSHASNN